MRFSHRPVWFFLSFGEDAHKAACLFTHGKPTRIRTSKLARCCVEPCIQLLYFLAVDSCLECIKWERGGERERERERERDE